MTKEFAKAMKKYLAKKREYKTKSLRASLAKYTESISYRNYIIKSK